MSWRNYFLVGVFIVLIWMRISSDSTMDNTQNQQIGPIQEGIPADIAPEVTNSQNADGGARESEVVFVPHVFQDKLSLQNIGQSLDIPDPDGPSFLGSNQNSNQEVSNVGQNIPLHYIDPLESFSGEYKSVGESLDPSLPETSSIYVDPIDTGPSLDIPSSSAR